MASCNKHYYKYKKSQVPVAKMNQRQNSGCRKTAGAIHLLQKNYCALFLSSSLAVVRLREAAMSLPSR